MKCGVLLVVAVGIGAACGEISSRPDGSSATDAKVPASDVFTSDTPLLQFVSSVPSSEAVEVARDTTIVLNFTTDIDPSTVTNSIRLEGPLGPVEGNAVVNGKTLTFTPGQPLHLLGDYKIEVSTELRSDQGQALTSSAAIPFQTIDGTWNKPATIVMSSSFAPVIGTNSAGDAVFGYTNSTNIGTIHGVFFDNQTNRISNSQILVEDVESRNPVSADINDNGNAVILWRNLGNAAGRGWSRFNGTTWITGTDPQIDVGYVNLLDNNSVTLLYNSKEKIFQSKLAPLANSWGIGFELADGFVREKSGTLGNDVIFLGYEGSLFVGALTGYRLEPKTLSSTSLHSTNRIRDTDMTSDSGDAFVTWTIQDSTTLNYSTYSQQSQSWQTQILGAGKGFTMICANRRGFRVGGYANVAIDQLQVVQAGPMQGFAPPTNAGPTTDVIKVRCVVDEADNALIAFGTINGVGKTYLVRYNARTSIWNRLPDEDGTLRDLLVDRKTGETTLLLQSTGNRIDALRFR